MDHEPREPQRAKKIVEAAQVQLERFGTAGRIDYPPGFITAAITLYERRDFLEDPSKTFEEIRRVGRNKEVWKSVYEALIEIDQDQAIAEDLKVHPIQIYLGLAKILGIDAVSPNVKAALADLEARYTVKPEPQAAAIVKESPVSTEETVLPDPWAEAKPAVQDVSLQAAQEDGATAQVHGEQTTQPSTELNSPEDEFVQVERLLKSVVRAEFDSFQEYSYVSVKSGNGFTSIPNEDEIRRDDGGVYEGYGNYELNREDDIVPYPKDLLAQSMRARSALIPIAVARLIDPALVTESYGQSGTKWGELYCVVGSKGGKVIIQGGGNLHVDRARRSNPSSFKLVFDSEDAANEYINWLITDPKDAYGPMLRRAIGSYDEQGNFRQALIPPETKAPFNDPFHDPFSVTPSQVIVKDYRQSEALVKRFQQLKQDPKEQVHVEQAAVLNQASQENNPTRADLEAAQANTDRVVEDLARKTAETITLGPGDLRQQVVEALERSKNRAEAFEVAPETIRKYAETDIRLPQGAQFEKLTFQVERDGILHITSKVAVNKKIAFKSVQVAGVQFDGLFRNNEAGGIYLLPEYKLGYEGAAGLFKDGITKAITDINGTIIETLNSQLPPGWQVKSFQIKGNKLAFDVQR